MNTQLESFKRINEDGSRNSFCLLISRLLRSNPQGLTRNQIERALGFRINQVSGRVNDLLKMGVVKELGTRVDKVSGFNGAVLFYVGGKE